MQFGLKCTLQLQGKIYTMKQLTNIYGAFFIMLGQVVLQKGSWRKTCSIPNEGCLMQVLTHQPSGLNI
jgi:hypothetical protein